ncbi:hypothetical protein DH2020_009722 [Rehmannia glutinosa]|uniref:Peroxidase n=1 Tax=Rehmannia glutinosa TaxID=99300 RepID=A0ABR0X9K0_REHGL
MLDQIPTIKILMILLVLVLYLSSDVEAQLRVDFYRNTCPDAESIIQEEVRKAFFRDRGIAPGLVRMHFHDCFVRGCDASILIKSTPANVAEEDGPPNAGSLRGFEVIESAKDRLEQECRGLVSCADILAYAARDSVVVTGGLGWDVPAGRRDGRISRAEETVDIPAPFDSLDQITQAFAKKTLLQDDMIALLGAHTIGRSHCTSFSDRLYNFSSTNSQDPTLDRRFAALLKRQCPRGPQGTVDPNRDLVVPMDPSSPAMTDVGYYRSVLLNRGLFTSDQTLLTIPRARAQVVQNVQNPLLWMRKFGDAMVNMGKIGVLTGNDGEIRVNCRVING